MKDIADELARLSPAKRELLQKLLRKKLATNPAPAAQVIHRRPDQETIIPTIGQQQIWFMDQLEPGNLSYNIWFAGRLEGSLRLVALERSLQEVVRRQEILRTTFISHGGEPVPIIAPLLHVTLPIIHLVEIPAGEQEAEVEQLLQNAVRKPFNLARGPLLRALLLRLKADEHLLLLTMHHIVSDGWSLNVLMRELAALYNAFVADLPSPLPELPIQYADFAFWQRQQLQDKVNKTQLAYWTKQLNGIVPLELPTDYPRPAIQTFNGACRSMLLPRALLDGLKALRQREEVTLFILLLASFQTLLYRYTGQTDIAVGTPIADRARPEVEGLIGYFINTLVIRTDLSGNPTFLGLLERVRRVVQEAFAHQDVPFAQLVAEFQPERRLSHPPLFQVMFRLQDASMLGVDYKMAGLTLSPLPIERGTSQLDVTFEMLETNQGLLLFVEYNTDLFAEKTITRLLENWQTLLTSIEAHPDQRLSELPLLTRAEQQLLLVEWNDTGRKFSHGLCLHEIFEIQVQRTPEALALHFRDEQLSYAHLNQRANQVAHRLRELGVGPDVRVGICIGRSLTMLVGLLGILKAGGAYVPLDPTYPKERVAFILKDAQVTVLLTQQCFIGQAPEPGLQNVCLDSAWETLTTESTANLVNKTMAEHTAYVIYTSGSTGTPKGVMISHRNIMNFFSGMDDRLGNERAGVWLAVTSISFDISVLELFWTLTRGFKVIIQENLDEIKASLKSPIDINQDQYRTGNGTDEESLSLPAQIIRHGVTHLQCTPSLANMMMLLPETGNALKGLQKLFLGGEALPLSLIKRLNDTTQAELYNMYGPTETTIWSTTHQLKNVGNVVSIGRPIANTQVYLLDAYLRPVPIGVIGEVHIGGEGLARGYLHQPGLTAEKFIPHPWSDNLGERLYKTGDLARLLQDGTIQYLRRVDQQVKIRGYRIELGEVEAVLGQYPGVAEAVVIVGQASAGDSYLAAYVVARAGLAFSTEELRSFLQKKLPDPMLPAHFVLLKALPLTPNGKVDRLSLPAPEEQQSESGAVYVAPETPIEELLVQIWREILRRPQVGITDNFFALGGHSLLATQLLARIRTMLQVEISLRSLFETPTIAGLAQKVEQGLRGGERPLPFVSVARTQALPLSFAQQRLWFLDQLTPGNTAYLLPAALRVDGVLSMQVLKRCLGELIQRHESLRTTFPERAGQPVQVIHPSGWLRLPLIDVRRLAPEAQEHETRRLATQEAQRPCNLAQGPLMRTALLRLATQKHVLLLTMHHIITDGWSNDVLLHELVTLYGAFAVGQPSPLPSLPIQYADFAIWQRGWLQGAALEIQLDYWKRQLAGAPPLELPTDAPRPAIQAFHGAHQSLSLPLSLSEALLAFSQSANITLFMLLLAAFQVLLARYSGQSDISVGTPIANRSRTELEGLIGFFANTLVLRMDLSGNPSFVDLLSQVRKVALEAYAHQDVPFEHLVDALHPQRDLSRSPLFQVLFSVVQPSLHSSNGQQDLTFSALNIETRTTKFDLSMFITDNGEGLHCGIEYNTELFEANTISRMLTHWQTLLQGIVTQPTQPLAALPLLSTYERDQILMVWNATHVTRAQEVCLPQLLEQQVERTPEAIALTFEDQQLSYHTLHMRATQLARYLRRQKVGPEVLVGVCLERSLEMVVGLLGILLAGGAYVPLDPSAPVARLALMLEETHVSVLLTQQRLRDGLPTLAGKVLCLDSEWESISQVQAEQPKSLLSGANLAYVIYTSGSTGRPKGAMNTQQGLCNRLLWMQETYHLKTGERVLQKTPYTFDVSVWEFFWPLLVGAQVVLARPEGHRESAYLVKLLSEQTITTVHFVPSMLSIFLQEPDVEACVNLRRVICSGEALSAQVQNRVLARLPAQVYNLYGPTEASIDVTSWQCQRGSKSTQVPIGHPIANTQIYLLDKHLEPVPVGVAGEVYIGGIGLARGYVERAEWTAERFVPHPFASQMGERLYQTGDVGRYQESGAIEYLGRRDQQVKLRGVRIELGEIEAALITHPAVRECVVMLREDVPGDKRLIAYIVPTLLSTLRLEDLRRDLHTQLPEYMLPAAFVPLQAFPLTTSGKIDRRSLPAPDSTIGRAEQEFVAPHTEIERQLAAIWSQVLHTKQVGIHDNFFAMGGDSILSLQIVSRARQSGIHITPKLLFLHQTIAGLAAAIAEEHVASPGTSGQGQVIGELPLTPIQRWFFAQQLTDAHHFNQAVRLRVQRHLNLALLERALHHLLLQHDALRLRFLPQDELHYLQMHASGEVEVPLTIVSLEELSAAEQQVALRTQDTELQASLNLQQGPLLRVLYVNLGKHQQPCLLIVIHHLVVDGVSWRILLEDLQTAYEHLIDGQVVQLPPKTTSFQQWAHYLYAYAQKQDLRNEGDYWRSLLQRAGSPLPTDEVRENNTIASIRTITYTLDREQTQALLYKVPHAYHTQINDILLTAFAQTIAAWTGEDAVLFHVEGHGRESLFEELDLSRTVGWFTSLYPILLDLSALKSASPDMWLKTVKEQLRAIPRRGIGYGLLRYLCEDATVSGQMQALPQPEISFNYLGQFDQVISKETVFTPDFAFSGATSSPLNRRAHVLDVDGSIIEGQLRMNWTYSQNIHRSATITALAQHYHRALLALITYCCSAEAGGYTPSDFPLAQLSQQQLDTLLERQPTVDDIYPLSPLQEGLLFHTLYHPDSGVYVTQLAWCFQGVLQVRAFEQAWQQAMERHPILRTVFVWDGESRFLQVVQQRMRVPIHMLDWRSLSRQEQYAQHEAVQQADRAYSFALEKGPLLRLLLAYEAEDRTYVLWSHHHLLLDGWSVPLLLKEVLSMYQQLCDDCVPIEVRSRSYRDYIAWLQQQDLVQAEQFWRQYLAGFNSPTQMLVHRTFAPAGKASSVHFAEESVSQSVTEQLLEQSRKHHLTMNTLLLGTWSLLLSHYSRERDVLFGATVAGRPAALPGVESMIGLFINTLPMRVSIELAASIWSWLERLQAQQVEIQHYDYTPLIKIQEWSEVPRGTALFESLLVFENYPVDSSPGKQNTQLEIRDVRTIEQTNYPLTIRMGLQDAALSLSALYDATRFESTTIRQMLRHLQNLLAAIGACREARLIDLPLLSSAEQYQLLIEWNRTRTEYGPLHGLHGPIESQVTHTPEAIAVIFGDMALTYETLNRRANRLAHYLRSRGVGPNMLVGLCVERSLEMVVGLLAILKAGGAYVPMDPSYPLERLTFMLQDAHMSVLLTQERFLKRWAAFDIEQVCLDREEVLQASPENLEIVISGEQLAYTIYTSGSTGTPKGVMLSHRNILNFFTAMDGCIGTAAPGIWLAVTSISFDISVLELFWTLARGFQVIIRAESSHLSSASTPTSADISLSAQIMQHAVTHVQGTPSLMRTLLMERGVDMALRCLRTILVGGEVFPLTLAKQLSSMTGATIINMYGPTETAVWSATHKVREEVNSIPIGRPIANTQLYILDAQLHLVPVGMQGELYIGGDGVSQGYLGRPALTAERFLPHPFAEQPGERLYRTGDLVHYLPNGTIEYVGRVDHQVKLRGYRIELGEIEAALLQHTQIRESVVVQREMAPGDQRLIAYVVTRQPGTDERHLQAHLQEKLPDYMLPSHIMLLETLPLTPNGKINRQALPVPEESAIQRGERALIPHRTIEEIFQQIWCEVLACEQVGIHDNFFESGGHSLLAMQMVSHIQKMFQVELPLRNLFETPTIAELAQQIEQSLRHEQTVEVLPILPLSRDKDLPLSFAQQRLWFLHQLEPENPAYNISGGVRLQGMLVVPRLARGLTEIVRRHESLRTTFQVHEGQPKQVIDPPQHVNLPLVDLQGLTASQREATIPLLARHEAEQPCDLTHGPLLRTWLLRLEQQEHVLLVTMHHIISDGWSSKVLVQELSELYQAFAAGHPSPLPPLPIQYADFALWQQQWLQGAVLEAQMRYWSAQLRNLAPLNLPTDHPRPPVQSFRGAQQTQLLPLVLHEQLKALSQREGVTLFMTLLASFQILLARYSGQVDIAVGTPIANRTRQEVEGLIGFFANTLVLRSDLSGNPSVRTVLGRVREVALGAYSYQDVPFEKIVEVLQPERDLHSSPLFQVMFILQNGPQPVQQLGETTISPLEEVSTTAKFDLTLEVHTTREGLLCHVEYRTDLFEPATVVRLLGHWHTLLQGMIAQPDQKLADLPLLTRREQQQLLLEWNATDRALPVNICLHQLIEQQVERTPERIAVSCREESLTYHQLNQQANRVAHALIEGGIGPEILVAVLAERSLPFLSALLAVLKANGAYLPLDPLHPVSRLRHMLKQSQCRVVLTTKAFLPLLSQVLDDSFVANAPLVVVLETLLGQAPSCLPDVPSRALPGHLAYVIYTSGSTGVPKGVMVEQQGMLNHMLAKIAAVGLSAVDSVAQNGPQGFDVSVWQSLAALVCGGHVQIVSDEVAFNPIRLLALLQERAISILQLVPALLRSMLAELRSIGDHTPELRDLRWLIPTGDALPSELCMQWMQRYPYIPVLNTYGSTECSDDQCHYPIEALPKAEAELAIVPIGFPISNMRVYVLDQARNLVPIGVVGELYLGGVGVGRGYLGEPTRTAEAFVPDPFGNQAGGRLYKTGDMVRFLITGNLEFLGRRDHLVKVRGYRIELGDIEAVLAQHPLVQESLVVARDVQEEQGKELVAYVVAKEATGRLAEEFRKYVSEKLPDYMLPRWFMLLEALPLNANGKVDRGALPVPRPQEEQTSRIVRESRTAMEEVVATIWSAVLGRELESIHDNFFAQGGHSLLATKVIARLRTTIGVELPLRGLFEAPTIAGLARQAEQLLRQGQSIHRPPEPISRAQDLPLSFAQQRLWFLNQLDPDNPAYNIPGGVRLRGTLVVQALEKSLFEIAQRHESLRTTFQIRNGQAIQIIHARSTFCLLHGDMSEQTSAVQEREVQRLVREEVGHAFNLTQGPLLRGLLLRLSAQEHILLLNMHHIVSDGWSMEVFVRELMILYRAFAVGLPSPLPSLPIQYVDFAVWQRDRLKGEVVDSLINYWKKQLQGAAPIEVPTDRPRPTIASNRGAVHTFTLSTQLSQDVVALSRQDGATLFMTLLTAFQILLYRYTGQQDIIVGTDIANRTYAETEEMIGFFVNLLVLRTQLRAQDTFREVLKSVFTMVLTAHAHQDLPFEKLIEGLQLERRGHQIPLVNALFVLQNTPLPLLELPGLTISSMDIETHTAKFDLAVFMTEKAQGLTGSVNFRTDLFNPDSITRLFDHFAALLQSIVASPDSPVETLEMYSEEEKGQRVSKEAMHREIHRSKLKVAKRNVIALPEVE